jgi:hypothetical protein
MSELHMLITLFLGTGVGYRWRGTQRSDKERDVFTSSSETHNKTCILPTERNSTFRETPGICEQAVSLNAPRGRAHSSVLSIP